ncbi:MAG: hypothetical protein ACJ735_06845 [Actinomycetes bacterium]
MSPDDEYADRLRDILRAEADAVVPAGDGLAHIRERTSRKEATMRWLRPVAVVGGAAVVAGAVAVGFALTGNNGTRLHENPPPPGASVSDTPTPIPTATPPAPVVPIPARFSLPVGQPLWPYADAAAALSGRTANPWSLDAGQTALRFTTAHLGFTDDNLVLNTTKSSDGKQAWVSIGYHTEGPRTATAAVVHVVQWSSAGPWEVVGTRDTTFSVTKPSYGATASSPLHVGGKIQGVDESIRVAVQQSSSSSPLGVACCTAAGSGPWSATVTYKSSPASVLTVVASTGGHITQHERWALTAVRNPTANASAAMPSTFIAVQDPGIGVFRSSDGSLVRWIVQDPPGNKVSDPRRAGSSVYYLRSFGCGNTLMQVPYQSGEPRRVAYHSTTDTITGYDATADGRLAIVLQRCSDNQQRLYVTDRHGRTNATAYQPEPPLISADPSWAGDGRHLAIVVRTGTAAKVAVIDAFATHSITSGTPGCGYPEGLPTYVTYAGASLVVGVQNKGGFGVVSCTPNTGRQLFFLANASSLGSLDADDAGNVITEFTYASQTGDTVIWSGGHTHHINVGTCKGNASPPQKCLEDPTW